MELQININPLELLSEAENYFSVSFCNDLQLANIVYFDEKTGTIFIFFGQQRKVVLNF